MAPFSSEKEFSDADVCKNYLCGFCPHEFFLNTKSDLGPCRKLHDETLKTKYMESATDNQRREYELAFRDLLVRLIADLERKIRSNEARLNTTPSEAW